MKYGDQEISYLGDRELLAVYNVLMDAMKQLDDRLGEMGRNGNHHAEHFTVTIHGDYMNDDASAVMVYMEDVWPEISRKVKAKTDD